MRCYVVQIDGYDPVTAAPMTLRAASHDDDRICHLDGQTWWPAIAGLPQLPQGNFDGDFGGEISVPSSSLRIQSEPWPLMGRYALADARIRIWAGLLGAPWPNWQLRFDGRITAQPRLADGTAQISFAVDDRWLDTPLLQTYTGMGGAEGPEALKGTAKALMVGAPRYATGALIDPINIVFHLSAYGAIEGVEGALDGLARFGTSAGDYPTYEALVAASIAPGAWATATAVGMTRHGAPPFEQITYMVRGDKAGPDGWARKPGELIRRIALLSGGEGRIDDPALDALDAARPWNLSIAITDQTTARQLVQRIAASVNAVAGVSWLGKLYVVPVAIAAPVLTLSADGTTMPPIASIEQVEVDAPWWRLAIEGERTWTVHAQEAVQYTTPAEPGADKTIENTAKDTLNVNGRPVEEVLSDLNLNNMNWFDLSALTATRDATMMARTTLEGQAIGTVVSQFKAEQIEGNTATAETFALQGAKSGDGLSWIWNTNTTKVGPDLSLGQYMQGVSASISDVSGSITDLRTVLVEPNGDIVAKAVFALKAGNKVAGVVATNNGVVSAVDFMFDAARFLKPDGTLMWGYDETRNVVVMPAVEVDTIKARVITAEQIVVDGVTKTYDASNASSASLTGAMSDYVWFNVVMERPGTLLLIADYQLTYASGASFSLAIAVNEAAIKTGTGTVDHYPSLSKSFYAPVAGTYKCAARASGADITINADAVNLIVHRTYA